MLRLTEDTGTGVSIDEMKDGDIGVIVAWIYPTEYLGLITQRHGNQLICLGARSRQGWGKLFGPGHKHPDLRVRILEVGETLVVGAK